MSAVQMDRTLQELEVPFDAKALLQDSHTAIDRKDYDAALEAYKKVVERMRGDEGLHDDLASPAQDVYRKLLLYKRLDDARAAVESIDKEALEHALQDARRLASEIGEQQTPLILEAKDAYARFTKDLNRIALEGVERY
jgi:hypothetical protein